LGTIHVLDAVTQLKNLEAAVFITSDKCYENKEWLWAYREDEPMGGHDPYSSSKGCAELVTSAYRQSFFGKNGGGDLRVASARAGNVIGGGDWATDRLVPDAMRAFLAGETLTLRFPGAVRPWQHVLEPLAGYLMLAERLHTNDGGYCEAWNFGPDETEARTVGWIAGRLKDLWGDGAGVSTGSGAQPHEAHFLKVDSSKARSRMGWRPQLTLDAALDWTVRWYRALQSGSDMREVTEAQIGEFTQLAS
ncbi:MAG: CDP-glucose 4,6-dehydratase, partial [Akkermansiaceae bacterium]|nr:CDP-glucose 4,6-dehydratase [Akkermansiaceae bacterium]